MLSTMSALVSTEPSFGNPIPDFQTGFTPWDCSDLFSVIQSCIKRAEPNASFDKTGPGSVKPSTGSDILGAGFILPDPGSVIPNIGVDEKNPFSDSPSPGSDGPKPEQTRHLITDSNSGSDERIHNRTGSSDSCTDLEARAVVDARKRKRMESNRESARRSRMRKQEYLENLRKEVNRLGLENRGLANQIWVVLCRCQCLRTENHRLMTEGEVLQRRLSELQQILHLRQIQQQWAYNNNVVMTGQTHQPFL